MSKANLKTINILIIEDNPADARLIQELLAEVEAPESITINFTFKTADKLEYGLELLSSEPFDVVMLDLSLPDSQGIDTFKQTQKNNTDVPIIVLSGLDDENMAVQSVREGAQDYLVKGNINGILLFRAIRYAIERKRTETELKNAYIKLKELDQLKSDFLSTVSHELKTPISIMREGISLCLDGVVGEMNNTQHELLGHTLDSVDRLNRLVTDLLDISKIEAGKIKLRKEIIHLTDIVDKCIDSYLAQAEKKNLKIDRCFPRKKIKIYADPDKITQIFNNLLSNAIRYSKDGGNITIEVTDQKDLVKCSVTDTGIGIDKMNLHKLFSKFEQFKRIEGPGYKGTGLGLAIAKGLVEMHGGKIWAESEINKGTTFWFTLRKGETPTVLIVDDDKGIVETVKEILNDQGYLFLEAFDGMEAVDKAVQHAPSLVILDMRMPAMSGYEVIGRLKQDNRTNTIPILIMSAYSINKIKMDQMNLHAAIPVLRKPFAPQELKYFVRDTINHNYN